MYSMQPKPTYQELIDNCTSELEDAGFKIKIKKKESYNGRATTVVLGSKDDYTIVCKVRDKCDPTTYTMQRDTNPNVLYVVREIGPEWSSSAVKCRHTSSNSVNDYVDFVNSRIADIEKLASKAFNNDVLQHLDTFDVKTVSHRRFSARKGDYIIRGGFNFGKWIFSLWEVKANGGTLRICDWSRNLKSCVDIIGGGGITPIGFRGDVSYYRNENMITQPNDMIWVEVTNVVWICGGKVSFNPPQRESDAWFLIKFKSRRSNSIEFILFDGEDGWLPLTVSNTPRSKTKIRGFYTYKICLKVDRENKMTIQDKRLLTIAAQQFGESA